METTWQLELRKMRKEDSFDDKFDTKNLAFIYAFQMGYKAGAASQDKHIDGFAEWCNNNAWYYVEKLKIWRFLFSKKELTTSELKELYFKSLNKL